MTKNTTIVTNNVFRSIRLFREGSSTLVLFFLQHGALRSYVTDHTAIVASRNKPLDDYDTKKVNSFNYRKL